MSANTANSAIHPLGVDKWVVSWTQAFAMCLCVVAPPGECLRVKADMVLFAGNIVWSISERVRGVREDALYTSTLPSYLRNYTTVIYVQSTDVDAKIVDWITRFSLKSNTMPYKFGPEVWRRISKVFPWAGGDYRSVNTHSGDKENVKKFFCCLSLWSTKTSIIF